MLTIKSQINKSSSYCIVVIADHAIFQFNIDLIPSDKNNKTDVENFVLDTHNPDHFIPISTVGTFNLKKKSRSTIQEFDQLWIFYYDTSDRK